MSIFSLLEQVKKSLRPDSDIIAVRDEVIGRINHELLRREIDAHAVGGGSVAKGTYLPLDHDVDIFVRFSFSFADLEEQLPELLSRVLKPFSPKRLHGSRDYFQFSYEGYDFEVIPVLAVDDASMAKNVTDMSPLHVDYFRLRGEGLEEEVRLTKQFCKSAGVYGAESYIRGFSGHVIDLLIIHYRSFHALVRAAASWKSPVIIDIETHHKDPLSHLNDAKLSPLVLIDPVQPDRNAAAALSVEQFAAFIDRSKAFLKNPSENFFVVEQFRKDLTLSRLKEHPGSGVWVQVVVHDDKKDIAGARVRKAFERVMKAVREAGFSVVEDGWHFSLEESAFWVCVSQVELSESYERQGPPVSQHVSAERFRQTHEAVSERDGRLHAAIARSERTLVEVASRVCEDISAVGKLTLQPLPLSAVKE